MKKDLFYSWRVCCIIADTASPPAPFESLSPGDVESISEGEIPEAEGEGEGEIEGPEIVQAQGTPLPSSPTQHEDHSLDAEQFEPILSDEEIADDSDPQVCILFCTVYNGSYWNSNSWCSL